MSLKRNRLQNTLASLILLAAAIPSPWLQADSLAPDELRVVASIASFDDITQVAAVYHLRGPSLLGSDYFEFAAGAFSGTEESRPMLSVGPAWKISAFGRRALFRFGISPTLIGGSTFADGDLGGNFHFTSYAEIANHFGKSGTGTIALRIQHTSNGGLKSINPGLDMIGINIGYRFDY